MRPFSGLLKNVIISVFVKNKRFFLHKLVDFRCRNCKRLFFLERSDFFQKNGFFYQKGRKRLTFAFCDRSRVQLRKLLFFEFYLYFLRLRQTQIMRILVNLRIFTVIRRNLVQILAIYRIFWENFYKNS